jgi:hypothetical protein
LVDVFERIDLSRAQIPVPDGGTAFHIAMGGAIDHAVKYASRAASVKRATGCNGKLSAVPQGVGKPHGAPRLANYPARVPRTLAYAAANIGEVNRPTAFMISGSAGPTSLNMVSQGDESRGTYNDFVT